MSALWTPSPAFVAQTRIDAFRRHLAERLERPVPDTRAVHAFSVADPEAFWAMAADFVGTRFAVRGPRTTDGAPMPATAWFPGSTLSYAANCLVPGGDDERAIVAVDEAWTPRVLTRAALRSQVARCAGALRREGVRAGDTVAAYAANVPETVIALLACSAIGAALVTASPDLGATAALERFGQLNPVVLLFSDSYVVNGRRQDTSERVEAIRAGLPGVRVQVGFSSSWPEWLGDEDTPLVMEPFPFDHPIYALFTSGTTGLPKALRHRAGGALLKHQVEHQLHCDVRPGDVVFYHTTCNWMMWNWLVSALASRATIVLYDGGLLRPKRDSLWDLIDEQGVTHFGLGAPYIHRCAKGGLVPREGRSLASLRCVMSTGAPLSPVGFAWLYEAVKADLHVASISGGTDIVGCFLLGDPTRPVHAGELQTAALGADVQALDGDGQLVPPGQGQGELVCRTPLPSMPLGLVGDDDAHTRYRSQYFERYPGVWHHGDLIEPTERGGVVVHGRSDATLKPGGVRVGTGEIYRALDKLSFVVSGLAAGKREGDDEVVWLFVVTTSGELDKKQSLAIRETIKREASASHVPREIFAVSALPVTFSGKLCEVAVKRVINGEPVLQEQAISNPESLDEIRRLL